MIISYKEDEIFDISMRLENINYLPFFQNQMNSNIFDYLLWNSQLQSSIADYEVVLQLLDDYYTYHQKFFCKNCYDSFFNSVLNIIQCFNIYNKNDATSLLIRIKIYKIIIHLIRFSKLSPLIIKNIFNIFANFLFDISDEDTFYSIQVISLLSKTPFINYLSKKFFKIFNTTNLQKFIGKKSEDIIYSLCNVLINMSKYPKINLYFIRNMIIIITEIISKYQNPAIVLKAVIILLNLSKSSFFCFQDLMIKNIDDDFVNEKISLFDFLQKQILFTSIADSSYINNLVITIFRILRRLIKSNNIDYFVCIEGIFTFMNSQNADVQFYSLKFFYYYLKCLNESIPFSSNLFGKFLNMIRENECQLISYLFSIAAIDGTLKMKTFGFLSIGELFKISILFDDINNFCDEVFVESICSFFDLQYDYLLFDSISGILIRIIEFEEQKEITDWSQISLSNLIFQSISIENFEYIAENADNLSNIRKLLLALKSMNQ